MAVGVVRRRAKARTTQVVVASAAPTLGDVVGPATYATWVEMLRTLVPQGRTHRLAVVVAAMLQHSFVVALDRTRSRTAAGASARALLRAADALDVTRRDGEIPGILARLFRDAGVEPDRVSRRGDAYSIIETAIEEFVSWENMPWE